MRRMSKREIGFRFELDDQVRVRIDRLEHGQGIARVDGLECRLEVSRVERRDVGSIGALQACVSSLSPRLGDGWLPRGKPAGESGLDGLFKRHAGGQPVCLRSQGLSRNGNRYEEFARMHPVGSLVEAEVIRVLRQNVVLRFDNGVVCAMAKGDYVNRWPYRPRVDRDRIDWSRRVEVVVRTIDAGRQYLDVSMHGYPQDGRYCNFAAGYRTKYDALAGMFRRLPWDRDARQ